MRPPFSITRKILKLISSIERNLGRLESYGQVKPQPQLRKSNRVRTLQGSLSIEGNTLGIEQITALLDGKRVLAPKNEIVEILNANEAYELMAQLNPRRSEDLLKAHGIMMRALISDAGKWRSKNVGILKQTTVTHLAPPPDRVSFLIEDLLKFLAEGDHPLIQSCVFHYEFEFIHPFSDGNGRIGRLWQSLILYRFHPVFEFIPVESIVQSNHQEYYDVLEICDREADSTKFIEFSLKTIEEALVEYIGEIQPVPLNAEDRLSMAAGQFGKDWFSRKDYIKLHKTISTATASRDLKLGVDKSILEQKGKQALTKYRFK